MKIIKDVDFLGGPLYVLEPSDDSFDFGILKEGESCYVIAGNGMFTAERTATQNVLRKTQGCGLESPELKEGISWQGQPMDAKTAGFIDSLFRAVYEQYATEAVVLLYQDKTNRDWYVRVPQQEVTAASADWKDGVSCWYKQGVPLKSVPLNVTMVGSAHSHGSMGAFFSAGDDADDKFTSGVHLVFGGYGTARVAARTTGGGKKEDLPPAAILGTDPRVPMQVIIPTTIKKKQFAPTYPGPSHAYTPYSNAPTYGRAARRDNRAQEYPRVGASVPKSYEDICFYSPEQAAADEDAEAAFFAEIDPDDFDNMSLEDLEEYRAFLMTNTEQYDDGDAEATQDLLDAFDEAIMDRKELVQA